MIFKKKSKSMDSLIKEDKKKVSLFDKFKANVQEYNKPENQEKRLRDSLKRETIKAQISKQRYTQDKYKINNFGINTGALTGGYGSGINTGALTGLKPIQTIKAKKKKSNKSRQIVINI